MGGTATRLGALTPGGLEAGRKRIAATVKTASIEALSHLVTSELAKLLGAASVRLYLRDPLTDEFYSRYTEGGRVRELRVAPDPSSVVGYAAMTRSSSFAWRRDSDGRKLYVVASPAIHEGDVLAVVELTNGALEKPVPEEPLRVFNEIVGEVSTRLQKISDARIEPTPYDFLLKNQLVTNEQLHEARETAARENYSLEFVLTRDYAIPKDQLGRSLSDHFRCPFEADPSARKPSADLMGRFSSGFLRAHAVLPVQWRGTRAEVVLANPSNLHLIDDIGRRMGTEKLTLSVAIREDILEALEKILPPPGATAVMTKVDPAPTKAEIPPAPAPKEAGFNLAAAPTEDEDSAAVRLVNEAIQAAVDRNASDIHLEPMASGGLLIRFRVDGVCHDFREVKEQLARAAVSRIKIMSELDIAEHRLPQDGKIRLKDKQGRRTDLRVAIVPTQGGFEDVVLRLLPEYQVFHLDQLGMSSDILERFKKVVEQPHGIALCVGPTGSGKTTTLHAALNQVKGPEVKIWTAEDPVEITQTGVRQVQMHPQIGLTFARALRAFLRCDPDIIMIGEIRDRETADAAIEASLTGHFVFSTLHTNSAPETLTRMLEMGLDPFTFGNSLMGVLAQRLVRKICEACADRYTPPAEEIEELRRQYGDAKRFDALGVDPRKLQLARGKGCDACFKTGYKGRVGIHELLVVTPAIRRLIQKRAKADELRDAAREDGLVILKQDGIRKVLQGKTDLKEVLSNTIEENI